MREARQIAWILIGALSAANVHAYEVWMGTHLATHEMATNLPAWSLTAPQLDGYNVNRAPHDTDPASNNDYRTIFAQFTKANSTGRVLSEVARSEITRNPVQVDELAEDEIHDRLSIIFGFENSFNYDLDILMFYDEMGTYQGTTNLYEWTDIEVQIMRDWMDANGHADVELMWNVRNNSVRNQYYGAHPLVDLIQIEASTTALLENRNNQITYLQWFWTNPATLDRDVMLQIPRALPASQGGIYNQYEGTRRVAVMLGGLLGYGEDGVRSDRLIFEPVTYNDNFDYIPETVSGGTAYANKLTSICLSLIEQKSLFEGRTRIPTNADADSTTRLFGPTVSPIADQVLAANTSTGPLAFTIDDDLTAPSSLTLISSSSDTNVVPLANIVLGGSGSNRTVTVTPAPGQSGVSEISVLVSDGTLGATETFAVTVLPPGTVAGTMFSDGADCSIKDTPAIEKLPDATVDVGTRGSGSGIERCTVYVFPLPDLGAVSNPFSDATFTFDFVDKNSTLRDHDLYGLGRRSGSTVLTSDYYAETATADPTDATRLQTDILTDSTPIGLVSTSTGGSASLVSYLNAQYASGAGAGEYVFLRINTRAPKSGVNYATLTMSEGGVAGPPDTRPRITYQAAGNSPPFISPIPDQVIAVDTNTGPLAFTVGDDATPAGSITLTGDSSNPSLVPVANIVFGGSDSNRTVTVTPLAGQLGQAELSIIANDGVLSTTNTFSLTVTPPPPPPPELIAGWDTWVDTGGDVYDATVLNGASGVAVGTADTSGGYPGWANWGGSAAHDFGASTDGTWGTLTDNPPSIQAASSTAAVGLLNKTPSGEMTVTISNTSGRTWLLSGFHFDGVRVRTSAADNWALSILAGSAVTQGAVSSGTILSDGSSPFLDREDVDIDLTGLSDRAVEPGESVIFELAWTGGSGAASGGNNTMIDNMALSGSILPVAEPPVLDYSLSGEDLVFTWSESGTTLQMRTNLTEGAWGDYPGGDTPPVMVVPTLPTAYFRLIVE